MHTHVSLIIRGKCVSVWVCARTHTRVYVCVYVRAQAMAEVFMWALLCVHECMCVIVSIGVWMRQKKWLVELQWKSLHLIPNPSPLRIHDWNYSAQKNSPRFSSFILVREAETWEINADPQRKEMGGNGSSAISPNIKKNRKGKKKKKEKKSLPQKSCSFVNKSLSGEVALTRGKLHFYICRWVQL